MPAAAYCAGFEFRPLAPPQAMPWGETVTAMVRPPRPKFLVDVGLVNSS